MNRRKNSILKRRGFSLIETLIAIFIFSFAIAMLSGSFSSFLKNYATEKREQRALEDAQYVLNLMEKTIRTSIVSTTGGSASLSFQGADGNMIKLFDNSQSKCLAYLYEDKKMKLLTKTGSDTNINSCGNFSTGYTSADLTGDNIESVKVSGWVSTVGKPGRVSISLAVREVGQTSPINIGMTVSLRDFDPAPTCTDGRQNGTETGKDCGGSCPTACAAPTFSCTGSVIVNATLCTDDNIGLTADTAYTAVDSCGAPKCEYDCNAGFVKSGNSCI